MAAKMKRCPLMGGEECIQEECVAWGKWRTVTGSLMIGCAHFERVADELKVKKGAK